MLFDLGTDLCSASPKAADLLGKLHSHIGYPSNSDQNSVGLVQHIAIRRMDMLIMAKKAVLFIPHFAVKLCQIPYF